MANLSDGRVLRGAPSFAQVDLRPVLMRDVDFLGLVGSQPTRLGPSAPPTQVGRRPAPTPSQSAVTADTDTRADQALDEYPALSPSGKAVRL